MRVILIEEKDAKALLQSLAIVSMTARNLGGYDVSQSEAWLGLPETTRRAIVDTIYSRFHFAVTRWLQDQGATGLQH